MRTMCGLDQPAGKTCQAWEAGGGMDGKRLIPRGAAGGAVGRSNAAPYYGVGHRTQGAKRYKPPKAATALDSPGEFLNND
jgi:hypothetical protein